MTSEQLAAAIREVEAAQARNPEGYLTSEELGEVWGVSQTTANKWLKRLKKGGYTVDVAKIKRPSTDGRMMVSYAYHIK